MAQSINPMVELTTTSVSYLGMGGRIGEFLLGNKGLELYSDTNVEDYIRIPWENTEEIGANVSHNEVGRHSEVFIDEGRSPFTSKDSGRILEVARQHIGNDKAVRMLTLAQTIIRKLSRSIKRK